MSFPALLEDWWQDKARTINLGMPAEIVSFTKATGRAEVQPLFKKEIDGIPRDYPILSKVPVAQVKISDSFSLAQEYTKGDLVWLSFCPFDISGALRGFKSVESDRLMGLENCVVLGKIPSNIPSLPGGSIGADGQKLFIKNNAADFYVLMLALFTALKSFSTIGGPTNQAADPATVAAITSVENFFKELFAPGTV